MSQYLSVPKSTGISVDISFHCKNENAVTVKDHSTGTEVLNANSNMNNNRHWKSPVNSNDVPKIYELRDYNDGVATVTWKRQVFSRGITGINPQLPILLLPLPLPPPMTP
jgi:hypothetical protein